MCGADASAADVSRSGFGLMVINRLRGSCCRFPEISDRPRDHQKADAIAEHGAGGGGRNDRAGADFLFVDAAAFEIRRRMIADLREQVQAHIGRLPVAFYDANKTGVMVSRIMSDVEGVRNLIGTGMMDFVGRSDDGRPCAGIPAAHQCVHDGGSRLACCDSFGLGLKQGVQRRSGRFSGTRPKITAEVTGRLTESLGGVRVVKGYHAEEREEDVFSAGVKRLLDNVLKTLTATSLMSLSATSLMGLVSAVVMYLGARQILAGHMTLGTFFSYIDVPGDAGGAGVSDRGIGTQITRGDGRARADAGNFDEKIRRRRDRGGRWRSGPCAGEVDFENVSFAYETGKQVLHDMSFQSAARHGDGAGGAFGRGKVHDHRIDLRVLYADERAGCWWTGSICRR